MRPLTEEETKTLFLKLSEYIGKNVEKMINRSDERHCFRLMKDRCYYVSESIMKASTNISRDNLLHVGTCLGKFTKGGKFRLHITSIEYLSQYAKVRNISANITWQWTSDTPLPLPIVLPCIDQIGPTNQCCQIIVTTNERSLTCSSLFLLFLSF